MTDLQSRIAAYHVQRFPTARPEHVALKIAEEAGELADAVNGFVSGGDFGRGDVVYEAIDVLLAVRALLARWYPEVDPDAEVEARLARFLDPNGGHRSCVKGGTEFQRPCETHPASELYTDDGVCYCGLCGYWAGTVTPSPTTPAQPPD